MIDIIVTAVLVAMIAAFIILLLKKIGAIEWLQVFGNDFVSKLANCDFCLSWWTCLIIAISTAVITDDWRTVVCAIFATPLCRKLL